MVNVNPEALVGRLNALSRRALEGAAGLAVSRTNYNIDVEHWLFKMAEPTDGDVYAVFRHYDVNMDRLQRDLTRALDKQKAGNTGRPAITRDTVDLAREGWLLASVEYGAQRTRSGHLLLALLSDRSLSRIARELSDELAKISAIELANSLVEICRDTVEAEVSSAETAIGDAASSRPGGGPGALDQFTIDLTARARANEIDPVLGRDSEVRQIADILTRRRQNNPILTGEAGVGKTAVVEGFALRIAAGDVPESLRNVRLMTLDLGLLQAGAGVKGEFEQRLKSVIDEVKASPTPIILFIDEAHTLIGAGGQAGQGDAANLLKPALARGELRTIAATTWAEYKKYFERDAALARRFQTVVVGEPAEKSAVEMMRGLVETLEEHHQVKILDEAVVESVRLSKRYITGRQLPDKSVSLLDTACARVGIAGASEPPALEDCRRRIEQLDIAIQILQREAAAGTDHADRISEAEADRNAAIEKRAALEERWEIEQELVCSIREARDALESAANPSADNSGSDGEPETDGEESTARESQPKVDVDGLREQLQADLEKLADVQGEQPLMQPFVDGQAVAEVVSNWTGIPVGRMLSDEIKTILRLKESMGERVVGQDHALDAIAQSIRTARAGLTDPRRPIGVFLLVGTSGTGKTETAMTLADLLYGGDQNMTVINMSEFKEEHKVSLLMGSPPGYVGYGEGGVLTEAVRRRPYSVVLLDELEKAHSGVQDVFYQVFDKGVMRDGEGRDIDFKNTIILATSNAGTDLVKSLCADPETRPDAETLATALHPELLKTFKPAFLGRVNVIPYFPLTDEVLQQISRLNLERISQRISEVYGARFEYSDELVESIVSRCQEVDTGARNIDHILTRTMLPELSAQFLSRMADQADISCVSVGLDDNQNLMYDIT